MNFLRAVGLGFHNYMNFTGRASRAEFWYWTLFECLIGLATFLIEGVPGTIPPAAIFAAFILVLPQVTVSIRRLHDLDRTGWWLLLAFTGIGLILLAVWACMPGTPGPNRFGPDRFASKPAAA